MGRVKQVKKTRSVTTKVPNSSGGFDSVTTNEVYWDTEYVPGGPDCYGAESASE